MGLNRGDLIDGVTITAIEIYKDQPKSNKDFRLWLKVWFSHNDLSRFWKIEVKDPTVYDFFNTIKRLNIDTINRNKRFGIIKVDLPANDYGNFKNYITLSKVICEFNILEPLIQQSASIPSWVTISNFFLVTKQVKDMYIACRNLIKEGCLVEHKDMVVLVNLLIANRSK